MILSPRKGDTLLLLPACTGKNSGINILTNREQNTSNYHRIRWERGLGRGPCSFNVQSLKVHLLMCVFVYYILCPECSDDGGSGGGGGLLCRVEV